MDFGTCPEDSLDCVASPLSRTRARSVGNGAFGKCHSVSGVEIVQNAQLPTAQMETLHYEHAEKSDSDMVSGSLGDDRTLVKQVASHHAASLPVAAKLTAEDRRRGRLARTRR